MASVNQSAAVAAYTANMAKRRAQHSEAVIALYRENKGHKTIANELGISPRLARTILIEAGEWKPGALMHPNRAKTVAKMGIGTGAKPDPEWKQLQRKLEKERRSKRTAKLLDLPLLKFGKKQDRRPKQAAYMRRKMRECPETRLRHTTRKRILMAVRLGKMTRKNTSAVKLLGCTLTEYRTYIESKWLPGMTWENHGLRGWHIDHIKPITAFDLFNESELRKAFHYTNTQPLWAVDNLRKGNKTV